VNLGRWREAPAGRHPISIYQVAFAADQFARLVPWPMLDRSRLGVLVHPNTGNDRDDHDAHALWLGENLALNLDVFGPR